MAKPNGDQEREQLEPTCEGMVTGMPGPIDDDQDNQDGGNTSPCGEGAH